MNKILKFLIATFIIMPLYIITIRFIPEVIFNLDITSKANNIIMIILMIRLAYVSNKWIFNNE